MAATTREAYQLLVGELGIPPNAAAIVNGIYAATGKHRTNLALKLNS
jgi:hypothetical protein